VRKLGRQQSLSEYSEEKKRKVLEIPFVFFKAKGYLEHESVGENSLYVPQHTKFVKSTLLATYNDFRIKGVVDSFV
jgi:hypothetical protein